MLRIMTLQVLSRMRSFFRWMLVHSSFLSFFPPKAPLLKGITVQSITSFGENMVIRGHGFWALFKVQKSSEKEQEISMKRGHSSNSF